MIKKRSKCDVFQGKKFAGTVCTNRLPVFSHSSRKKNFSVFATKHGICQTSLTQTHRDILDAIFATSVRYIENEWIETKKDGKMYVAMGFIFRLRDVLNMLGTRNHHQWLIKKIKEISNAKVEINTDHFRMYANIVGSISEVYSSEKRKEWLLSQPKYYIMTLTPEFYSLILSDYKVYMKREIIQSVLSMRHDILRALVRFASTNEEMNIQLRNLLSCLGYPADKRTKSRVKSIIIQHREELSRLGIAVQEKDQELFISYQKNPKMIAIDYEKQDDKS